MLLISTERLAGPLPLRQETKNASHIESQTILFKGILFGAKRAAVVIYFLPFLFRRDAAH